MLPETCDGVNLPDSGRPSFRADLHNRRVACAPGFEIPGRLILGVSPGSGIPHALRLPICPRVPL